MEFFGIKGYTTKQVADMLKLSERTVLQYLRDKKIIGQKVGKSWFIAAENINKYLKGE